MPRKERVVALFDALAPSYDGSGVAFFAAFGRDLVADAGLAAGQRVLDVGSGRGAVTLPAAEAVRAAGHVEAIDLSVAMVEALQRDVEARGLRNVSVRPGDAEAPGVEAASFDAVLASFVLFFLPDLDAALAAFRGALRPGGQLGFTTFGETEEGWRGVERVLLSHLPEGDPRRSRAGGKPEGGALASAEAIERTLHRHGYAGVRTSERAYEVAYGSPEGFVRWSWTTGLRAIWESVPKDRLEAARAAVLAAAAALVRDDGELVETVPVRFTLARRP